MAYKVDRIIGLNAKEYEDPRDAMYLKALKLNKGFDATVKLAMDYGLERCSKMALMGSNVRATKENMAYLIDCVERACAILEIDEIPQIYIDRGVLKAYTSGTAHPILVISYGCLKMLTEDELMFVIGHELGHIKSEHYQYHYLGSSIASVGKFIPVVGEHVSTGILYAYEEWARRSDFTADRAGLLVSQNLEAAITTFAKLGGFPPEYYDRIEANQFLEQSLEFKELDDDMFNKLIRIGMQIGSNHSWAVLRAKELMLWVQSGEYSRILKRNSTWIKNEIEKLSEKSNKAFTKLVNKKNIATEASRQLKERKALVTEESEESNIIKGIVSKGRDSIRNISTSFNEESVKKKLESVKVANEKLRKVGNKEKYLRNIYKEISDDIINNHINETVGNLIRIE